MILNDWILQEDIELLAEKSDWSKLYNSSILITGATGLIGRQLIFLLLYLNENKNANIRIYALIRNEQNAKTLFGSVNIDFILNDIRQPLKIGNKIDFIVHSASITESRVFVDNPVETIDTAYTGTRNVMEFARLNKVQSIVYLSSMEVFGITDSRLSDVKESDYGYIDILNPRSSYSESKRLCECLCVCYSAQFGVPVKIARLTQTLGAGIGYSDTRVGAYFARCVIEQKNIVLNTEGNPRRPCLYTRDAISAIFSILLKGKNGEAYTVANSATAISIREIAELISTKIAENKISVKFNITNPQEYAFNQGLNLFLNTDKLESLGWYAEVGLEDAYRRMIESMKCRQIV
jgi:dTDP-glucose 4,6-dehydratase